MIPKLQEYAFSFDLDGTLVETQGITGRWVFLTLMRHHFPYHPFIASLSDEELTAQFKDKSVYEAYRKICIALGSKLEGPKNYATAETLIWEHEKVYCSAIQRKGGVTPKEDALGFWKKLIEAGVVREKIGIVTNSTFRQAEIKLDAFLQSLGRPDFQKNFSLICADDTLRPKPSPEGYQRSASKLKISPRGHIAIEDTLSGAQAALSANVRLVLLRPNGPLNPEAYDPDRLWVVDQLDRVELEELQRRLG